MSRCQIIKAHNGEVCFRGISISSWNDLQAQIKDKEDYLIEIKEQLKMMAIAQPRDIVGKDDDIVFAIKHRIDDVMEDYEDNCRTLYYLYAIQGLIEDYKYKADMSLEDAWNAAVVDMYADLRNEIKNHETNT